MRNVRQRAHRVNSPVHDAPILGSAQIFDNILECLIVFLVRVPREASKETDGIGDVQSACDVCVHALSKELSIVKLH